ncbi:hypothetical protein XA68_14100 [Ophiocordyceps unilateralis]|uniref:Uncharacterized protein n=1 Tax=Ophiocordyceps unilateralis TaxID=268505 RepID=A0A2A9PA11_OPHUN|nr:hypothetical protein XA68_14100 [Ophiocordyceps unilateralis]
MVERKAAPVPADFPTAADGPRPAVDGDTQTMQMMQTLMERLDRLEENMQSGYSALSDKIDALDERMTEANRISLARIVSGAQPRSDVLAPLYSYKTGELIEGFPRTLRDLEELNEDQVDGILGELEYPVDGEADEKKQRLKWAIGVMV